MNNANTGETENSALLLKILTIGDTAVGKTCLIMRFSGEEFTQSFITTVGIGK
jgi:GTPase SAR1 family protein